MVVSFPFMCLYPEDFELAHTLHSAQWLARVPGLQSADHMPWQTK
jgi:hypothetical protein